MLKRRATLKRSFLVILIIQLSACTQKVNDPFEITALPIDAKIHGELLTGPSVLNDPNRFVWGANVIKGKDGRYHMLYNTFDAGDSLPEFTENWVLGSKIAYAVSDYPDRDFKFKKIILQGAAKEGNPTAWDAQMVTNPHIKRFNDTFYLYYVGSVDPKTLPKYESLGEITKRNRVQQFQQIGVLSFNSFEDLLAGNFIRPSAPILSPRTRVKKNHVVHPSPQGMLPLPDNIIVTNPAVVYRPSDNKYLLFFKGNLYDPNWRGVHGVAISDTPTGPFQPRDTFVFDVPLKDGRLASAEDPFVWYHSKRKLFYAIIKDFSGKITEADPGLAILNSKDGIHWTKPKNSLFMKKSLLLKSGEEVSVNRLERPFMLVDPIGNPLVFFAACSLIDINPTNKGASFNVHIPVLVNR